MAGEVKGPAIGIDLGTTYSCVAVWRHGRVEIIVNGQGNRTTPSYVAFSGTDRLVGDAAKNQAARNPTNTIFDAKRLIGRRFSDPIVQADAKLWPFRVVDTGDNWPKVAVQYNGEEKQFTAVDISCTILSNMREVAEAQLGTAIKNAVVTVPAYFSNSQRQETMDAATAAGLQVLRIINEPTAAAIAYSLDTHRYGSRGKQKKKVLVFDLGGGTFDVSILTISAVTLSVIATAGDNHLGGVDFDNRLVEHCARWFEKKHGKDITGDHKAVRRLKVACERAKRTLSFLVETMIEVDYLHDGIDFQYSINVAKFEELNMDLFKRCMDLVDNCLQDAKMKKEDIDEVLLVGGSTRIPKIQQLLQEAFAESSISKEINPDEAVASGAAICAAMLRGDETQVVDDLVLSDVTPLSLGVHTMGGLMSVLIPRNTALPAQHERFFTTTRHNQDKIKVQIFEGERPLTSHNHLLGILELSGIQPASIGNARISVKFELNEDGILTVTAEDQQTKEKANIAINRHSEGKSAGEVKRLVEEAENRKKEDDERTNMVLARNKLKEYACRLRNEVKNNITVNQKAKEEMEKAISETLAWLKENNMAAVERFDAHRTELVKKWNVMAKKETQKRSNRLRIWPWVNKDR